MYLGIEFHNSATGAEKARAPYELDLIHGIHNSERSDDLNVVDGWYSCMIAGR